MPHIIVKLYPGRSEQLKKRLTEEIVKNVVEIAECKEDTVSVAFEEIEASDWAQKVFQPDIIDGKGTLYKKPGYDPFLLKQEIAEKPSDLKEHIREAARVAQKTQASDDFNAMSWLDVELEDNPESFDCFFDMAWNELSESEREKRAMTIRGVL
ncbi:MAG: tautomerase family protein [Pseudomonadota bacterium]